MRSKILLFVVLGSLVTVAPGFAGKKRVAVLDFEFGTVQQWWSGNWDIGKGISDLIVTELVTDGTYSVIERSRLDAILAEQNFSNSDRASPATAARIGEILGVDAIIVGSITQFGTEQKDNRVGAALGRWGGVGAGKVGTSKGKATVAIDARVVDVHTAEILAVAKGLGESSRSGLLLGGFGAGRGGFGAAEIDMSSSDFRETILGEAVQEAVTELSSRLVEWSDRLPEHVVVVDGLVADIEGGTAILNVGSSHGVQIGDLLRVLRVVRTVKDPATGEVLRSITSEVGSLRVTEVDERSAVATVVSGSGITVGDQVTNR